MKELHTLSLIAFVAIISSCGGSGQRADKQVDNEQTQNEEQPSISEQGSTYITLNISSKMIETQSKFRLGFSADSDNTLVKIVNGNRDTTFMVGKEDLNIEYLAQEEVMTIYGNITDFQCNGVEDEYYSATRIISSLDISKNPGLKSLSCYDNELGNLDISKNTTLKSLYCSGNKLENLDISKNTALEELYCEENMLKNLDISQNTNLKTLYCDSNQLKSLDISKNTDLTELNCRDNSLTELDVSNNKSLTRLYCDGNEINHIDLSNNTLLQDFYISKTEPLNTINLKKHKELSTVYWKGKLTSDDVDKLIDCLPDLNGLEYQGVFTIPAGSMPDLVTPAIEAKASKKNWDILEDIKIGSLH